MKKYGLIGKNISYSFSQGYFKNKFEVLNLCASYQNFDCIDVAQVVEILKDVSITGYNVTIPYKQDVIEVLDVLDPDAAAIGAVNTIKRSPDNMLYGYNTDFIGFREALFEHLPKSELIKKVSKALILGTGGASKAVVYALESIGIACQYISRKQSTTSISYQQIDAALMFTHQLIVNCTPLGTHPDVSCYPDIPYHLITEKHLAYDLIYNPSKTTFLKRAEAQGAFIINGLRMLQLQAEAAWAIWNK